MIKSISCLDSLCREFPLACDLMTGVGENRIPTLDDINSWAKNAGLQQHNNLEDACLQALDFLRSMKNKVINSMGGKEGGQEMLMGNNATQPCTQSLDDCLPVYVDQDRIPVGSTVIEINGPPIQFDPNIKGHDLNLQKKEPLYFGAFYPEGTSRAEMKRLGHTGNSPVTNLIRSDIPKDSIDAKSKVWTCSCLIIRYPIKTNGTELVLYRKYSATNGYFTWNDLSDRISYFYTSPFSPEEFDCILYQLSQVYRANGGQEIGHWNDFSQYPLEFQDFLAQQLLPVVPSSSSSGGGAWDIKSTVPMIENSAEEVFNQLRDGQRPKNQIIPLNDRYTRDLYLFRPPNHPEMIILTTHLDRHFVGSGLDILQFPIPTEVNLAVCNQ